MSLKKIKNLRDIPRWHLCCGCGVCAFLHSDKIVMEDISSVGRRPRFLDSEETGIEYGLVVQACPGIRLKQDRSKLTDDEYLPSLLKDWGPVISVWEGYAADTEIRYKGSSGGVITALSLYCLEHEGMKGALHVKADSERPHLNVSCISTDRDSLVEGVGSRYSPASPCEKLGDIEKTEGAKVIVGKPCDIAAVKNVRSFKKKLDKKIGLTIACFCAGTPSTSATLRMLQDMGVTDLNDMASLRYRGYGWPGRATAKRKKEGGKNQYLDFSYERSWGNLQKHRQWRCYICPDHTGELADIAVGDPWYKKNEGKDDGRSLIIVRSKTGERILRRAIAMGYLVVERKEPEILPASQPNIKKAKARLWGQLVALKLLRVPCPEYSGFYLFDNWYEQLSILKKIRSILGTMKRVYIKKIWIKDELSL